MPDQGNGEDKRPQLGRAQHVWEPDHTGAARACEPREGDRRGSRSHRKPLESDMVCFTLLKGHSGCFVGTEYEGTSTEEGR